VTPQPQLVPDEPVSAVVPARDEAGRIGPLLMALRDDPAVHEIVVVDDESVDGTGELAAALGARVVEGQPLPMGWTGKPWALQQGLEAANGYWVVALDADTVPARGAVAALVDRCDRGGWDLVTGAAQMMCRSFLQQVLHPALLTTLVYRYGPPGARRPPPPARLLANGQVMCVRRFALLGTGGFRPVRASLVEDVALVRHLAQEGWRIGFLDATPAVTVTMYDGAAEAWRGWGRSLPLVDATSPARMAADLAVVWLAQALPLVRWLLGRADALDLALLALRLGTLVGTRRAYRHPGPGYWLSPLADGPAAVRLTQAALRPERTWRGRTYARPL
jgi:dolichol-phosphate mannosyltransferase